MEMLKIAAEVLTKYSQINSGMSNGKNMDLASGAVYISSGECNTPVTATGQNCSYGSIAFTRRYIYHAPQHCDAPRMQVYMQVCVAARDNW